VKAARAFEQHGAWAIVLVDAQRTIPGVKATDRRTFRGTVRQGMATPLLFTTREDARKHRREFRAMFGSAGLHAIVVPVRVTVQEMHTLESAKRGTP
jgi:hypothetical protein